MSQPSHGPQDTPSGFQHPPPQGAPVEPPREEAPQSPPQPVEPAAGFGGQSLLDRAKAGDEEAMATMFSQFLPPGEHVVTSHYLGVLGFWAIGTHSFAGVTQRRIATLRLSFLGGVHYQDGSLEYINSAAVMQPSKASLYVYVGAVSLAAFLVGLSAHIAVSIVLLLLSLLALPLTVRIYYRFKKSGLVVWVREGLAVYAFIDRTRMRVSNQLYRECMSLREERLREVGRL